MTQKINLSGAMRNVVLLGACVLLSACASADAKYPTFAIPTADPDSIAETGRVSMRFPAVNVPQISTEPSTLDPLPEDLDARLAAITTQAMAATNAFSADAEATRALANAAAGKSPESDPWTLAQVRLAALTSHHSATHLALADLDALAVSAQIAGSAPDNSATIAELQEELAQTLEDQARQLAAITAQLDR